MSKPRSSYNPNRPFIGIGQLAEYFGLHRNTLRRYLKEFKPDYNLHRIEDVIGFIVWYANKMGMNPPQG